MDFSLPRSLPSSLKSLFSSPPSQFIQSSQSSQCCGAYSRGTYSIISLPEEVITLIYEKALEPNLGLTCRSLYRIHYQAKERSWSQIIQELKKTAISGPATAQIFSTAIKLESLRARHLLQLDPCFKLFYQEVEEEGGRFVNLLERTQCPAPYKSKLELQFFQEKWRKIRSRDYWHFFSFMDLCRKRGHLLSKTGNLCDPYLNLDGSNLQMIPAKAAPFFQNLQHLSLKENPNLSYLPTNLLSLSSLKRIDLSLAQFQKIYHFMQAIDENFNGAQLLKKMKPSHPSLLAAAIALGDEKMAAAALKKGDLANGINRNGDSFLTQAIEKDQLEIVELLLQAGAELSDLSLNDKSLSSYYLYTAIERENLELIDLLLQRGVSVNIQDRDGISPLYYAAGLGKKRVARFLLKKGANVDLAEKNYGYTPLHLAIYKQDRVIAALLFKYNAQPYLKNHAGFSPFNIACENGCSELMALFS